MQVALPPDAAGFIGFECPQCRRYFKIVDATHNGSHTLRCAYCGHSDDSETSLTAAEVDYLKQVHFGEATAQLQGQFEDDMVNTFRNSENVTVTREHHLPPSPPPRPMERDLPNQNTCGSCGLVYAVESDAKICPQCAAPAK
ncbi:MAG: hypothetical protein KF773_24835 [Deltaproteobacteria bacterium]|nr:hypothetical protein [Deltaproteobacteria bacterium]